MYNTKTTTIATKLFLSFLSFLTQKCFFFLYVYVISLFALHCIFSYFLILEHNHLIVVIIVLLLVVLLLPSLLPALVLVGAWSLLGDAVGLADGRFRSPGLDLLMKEKRVKERLVGTSAYIHTYIPICGRRVRKRK